MLRGGLCIKKQPDIVHFLLPNSGYIKSVALFVSFVYLIRSYSLLKLGYFGIIAKIA